MQTFAELPLAPALQRAVTECGFVTPTPVQAGALPAILNGRDVMVQARTGSGKTVAFALGLLQRLKPENIAMQSLVLCPTRELADQVAREIRRLAIFIPNVKVLVLTGGVSIRPQLSSLSHPPHIVVGTPGRVHDILRRDVLAVKALKTLVLDEADRMLDMGFAEDMRGIVSRLPSRRQTLLFSATLPDSIQEISRGMQRDPLAVDIEHHADDGRITQVFHRVSSAAKVDALAAVLAAHQPQRCIVFCNLRAKASEVAQALAQRGFAALALHGEMDQRDRDEVIVQFGNHSCTVLVASDVAARGLDIVALDLVVNFDVANDADTHVHRVGRTGRAGLDGLAVTLVSERDQRRADVVAERIGPLDWQELPTGGNAQGRAAEFITLAVDGGKTDKIRPGDLLGALTGEAKVPGDAVGRIDIFPMRSYVAVHRDWADRAAKRLREGRIKNRRFRVRKLYIR